ncbi:hypothetical protein CRUP_028208 [Coryphaenoides rupestris]|nr:hypothetical protein CRUP_028208 [Coryphaenoides rupestris]
MSLLVYPAEEIRRLRRQMEELRKESGHYIELLKAHDINFLEDPTIHWKGKQRSAKVAKVTPTHQLPKGIIVYSNGNVICPARKEPGLEKHQTPRGHPGAAGARRQRRREGQRGPPSRQCRHRCVFRPLAASRGNCGSSGDQRGTEGGGRDPCPSAPAVSYITLQIPAVNTSLPQQPQSAVPSQNITIAATPVSQLSAQPVVSLATVAQAGTHCSTADTAVRTVGYTSVPSSTALLRAGAAGSTQTTWTTLHLTGNTVQPVCQSVPMLEGTTNQTLQQLTVCPMGNKPTAQPIKIQIRPQVPLQQAPVSTHIQAQPVQRLPQLHSAIMAQTHPQPMLTPQPQSVVLPQPAVMSQPPSSVLQPASVVPHLQTALIPQPAAQPLPQPALVPQPQATVLPLLQTMQVLQVNPSGATVSGVTTPQNTNNPSVVILQQANACSSQSTVRDELANQMSCQHIVIIQAPNQVAPAPQNPQVSIVPAALPTAVPALSTQITTTNCTTTTTNLHMVGGKQLVHILPRPVPPQISPSKQGIQASSAQTSPSAARQTITVNGQVFALQPMNTSDKAGTQGSKSTLQLVQPTTAEEPTTNVALNSLGALSSLNKSISQGLPLTITSQTNHQMPAAPPLVVQQQQPQQKPTSAVAPAVQEVPLHPPSRPLQALSTNPLPPAPAADATKATRKKASKAAIAKRGADKRTKPPKRRDLRQAAVAVAAKPVVSAGESPAASTSTAGANIAQSEVIVSRPSVSGAITSPPAVKVTTAEPTATAIKSKPVSVVGGSAAASKVTGPQTKPVATVTEASLKLSKPVCSTGSSRNSRVSAMSVTDTCSASSSVTMVSAVSAPVCATVVSESVAPGRTHGSQATSTAQSQSQSSKISQACSKPEPHTSASPSVSSTAPPLLTVLASSSSMAPDTTPTSAELRKRVAVARSLPQQPDLVPSTPSPSCMADVKLSQGPIREREAQKQRHVSAAMEKQCMVESTALDTAPSRKDYLLSQPVYTNLDHHDPLEHHMSARQTDSPMSVAGGGGRGFSVASMLPQGHSIGASSGSFGTFTFTSEQADIVALAMLEQEIPGRRGAGCPADHGTPAISTTMAWEPPKIPQSSASQERGSAAPQVRGTKPMEAIVAKPPSQGSVRAQAGEVSIIGPTGTRHPPGISYSQTQSHPQAQSQCGTSLSVNNLIRPNSSQQPYPGSPSLSGQQGSVPSPVGSSGHLSQSSNSSLPPARLGPAQRLHPSEERPHAESGQCG